MTTKQTVLNYYSAIHAEKLGKDYISDKLAYGFNSAEQKSWANKIICEGAGIF